MKRFSMVNLFSEVGNKVKPEASKEKHYCAVVEDNTLDLYKKLRACESAKCAYCDDSELACCENIEAPVELDKVASCSRWVSGLPDNPYVAPALHLAGFKEGSKELDAFNEWLPSHPNAKPMAIVAEIKRIKASVNRQAITDDSENPSFVKMVEWLSGEVKQMGEELAVQVSNLSDANELTADDVNGVLLDLEGISRDVNDITDNGWSKLRDYGSGKAASKANTPKLAIVQTRVAEAVSCLRKVGYGEAMVKRILSANCPACLFKIEAHAKEGRRLPDALITAELARGIAANLRAIPQPTRKAATESASKERQAAPSWWGQLPADERLIRSKEMVVSRINDMMEQAVKLQDADTEEVADIGKDLQNVMAEAATWLGRLMEEWQAWSNDHEWPEDEQGDAVASRAAKKGADNAKQ